MTDAAATLLAQAEVAMALAEISEGTTPSQDLLDALEIDRNEGEAICALLVGELPPFASIYLSSDGNIGGEAQAEIAGFYSAISVPPPPNPDYLSSMLYLLGQIIGKEAEFDDREEPKAKAIEIAKLTLVRWHLVPWLVPYLLRAEQITQGATSTWSGLTFDLISSILERSKITSQGHSEWYTEAKDEAIELFANSDDFVSWVTTPRLSGVILAPSDLSKIASSLGLAARVGRKRFTLEGLIQQSSREVLSALAKFCASQCDLYTLNSQYAEVLEHWKNRAARTKGRILATIEAQ